MPRLLFEKTGDAVWISHLDLMRLFQRGFQRAGLRLTHSQGFHPRPSLSIALPLSVGTESRCELLDFALEGEALPWGEILTRLNRMLVPGVTVREVYEGGRKLRELELLRCEVDLEYDRGIPRGAEEALRELFARESLPVARKTKDGLREQDIAPMIRSLAVTGGGENTVKLEAVVCCQNPALNPMQLGAAVEAWLPGARPDFCRCRRVEVYDGQGKVFR